MVRIAWISLALLVACKSTSAPAGGGSDTAVPEKPAPTSPPVAPTPVTPGDLLANERNSIDVFRSVAPSTVFVTEKRIVRDRWSLRPLEVPAGTGTGWVYDTHGNIVTNFHVVAEGSGFDITLSDGRTLPGKLVGVDPTKDVAVLHIDVADGGLKPVKLAPPKSEMIVGEKAIAIGNPFGLDHTLTVGVISALGREVQGVGGVTIRDMIQTDAAINPGNSGGPLLNSAGELIGMNAMIFSKSGTSSGVGFAVPVSTLRRVVPQLIKFGRPIRAGFGVEVVSDSIAEANGIEGVVIASVKPGSPAARAGLRGLERSRFGPTVGDIIVGIDGNKVRRYDDLFQVLDQHEPGDHVTVELVRGRERRKVEMELIAET